MRMFCTVGLALIALFLAPVVAAQNTVLEVIDLKYRAANEVMSVLQPFVAKEGSINQINNQLIVRTTPQNLVELKKILESIDRKPRRLMITVKQDADFSGTARGADVSGRVEAGDVSVSSGGGNPGNGARARVWNSQSAGADRSGQKVQVLEGNTAFLQLGTSAPIVSRSVTSTPIGPRVTESTQFREANTGVYVRPRVQGARVTLEIAGSKERFIGNAGGATSTQRFDTVVSGQLGEWIEIGGATQSRDLDAGGISYRSSDALRDERRVFVMVEELP